MSSPARNEPRAVAIWLALALAALAGRARGGRAEEPAALTLDDAYAEARRLGAAGEPLKQRHGKLRAHGKPVRATFELAARQCIVAGAVSDALQRDLDLRVRTGSGISLRDGGHTARARIRYCAGTDGERVQVQLRGEPRAAFVLGVWGVRGQVPRSPPVQASPPGPPEPEPGGAGEAPEASSAEAASAATSADAPGDAGARLRRATAPFTEMGPEAPRGEAPARPGEPVERTLPVVAGRCYRLAAAVGAPLSSLSIDWRGPGEADPPQHVEGAPAVVLGARAPLCPAQAGVARVRFSVLGEPGLLVWQLLGAPDRSAEPALPVGGEGQDALSKRLRELHGGLEGRPGALTPYEGGELKVGGRREREIRVSRGTCYTVLVASVPSLRGLELEIADARDGTVVTATEKPTSPVVLRACAALNGRWKLRLRAAVGYGAYGLQVFTAAAPAEATP